MKHAMSSVGRSPRAGVRGSSPGRRDGRRDGTGVKLFGDTEVSMPEEKTLEAAARDKRQGKSPSTQAGEFVREEIEPVREGTHGARSTKQAIAIGLSKARRAGVDLPPPGKGAATERTRRSAARAYAKGKRGKKRVSATR